MIIELLMMMMMMMMVMMVMCMMMMMLVSGMEKEIKFIIKVKSTNDCFLVVFEK
jgi:hypothetical protein